MEQQAQRNNKVLVLRALAIMAVVVIHTMPSGFCEVVGRPFVNFAVALFLFLSGYLTRVEHRDWRAFYLKRTRRVLIPYLIWTVVYTLGDKQASVQLLMRNICTTGACGVLYYIFVYLQCVLLTPWTVKLALSRFRIVGWLITPMAIVLYQSCKVLSGEVNPAISQLYGLSLLPWFIFYYAGLLWGNRISEARIPGVKSLLVLYVLSLLLQMSEGYGWYIWGDANCGTQTKLTAILSSLLFMCLAYRYLNSDKCVPQGRFLLLVGHYSFGIYLSHIAVKIVFKHLPLYPLLPFPLDSAMIFFGSLACVYLADRFFGPRFSRWLGLV